MHPYEEFYCCELAVKLSNSLRSIKVALRNLEKINLILKRISGKQHIITSIVSTHFMPICVTFFSRLSATVTWE